MADAESAPLDPTDPYFREAQTFPVLPQEMVARISAYGQVESIADGRSVFERGQRRTDFFLVIEGSIDILMFDDCGRTQVLHSHRSGQFTGEVNMFNDRKTLVSGRAAGDTLVARIAPADFTRMIAAEPDIGEIIMRAFILRRVGLVRHRHGGVTLIGPGHGAAMVRLNAFLTRNNYPPA